MLKKCAYFILIFIFFILIFFKLQKSHVSYNFDEVSWYFHTVFFDELFLKHNLDKNLWLSVESFDHPQLSKYIFGAYLFSKNKEYAHDRDKLLVRYGRWKFYADLKKARPEKPFYTPINTMREVNLAFTFLTLVILHLICKILTHNVFISLVFVFTLASSPLFTQNMLTATPDAQYIFFTLLAIFSYIQYIRSQKKLYIYLFALFCGLSLTAKLTGALMLIVYLLYLLLRLFHEKKHKLLLLKEFLVVSSIVAVIWMFTNPAIIYAPVKSSISYFSSRIKTFESYAYLYPDYALTNIQERLYAAYCILLAKCHGYSNARLFANPFLNILLALFGFLYLIQLMKGKRRSEAIFLSILFILVIIGSLLFIPLQWPRYYLPLTIFLRLLQFMGITYAVNFVIKHLKSNLVNQLHDDKYSAIPG